jgi:glycosyltransferase involved in cell wall biosynthesis
MTTPDASPPLVSYVMPAWNPHPIWLREAVDSVLAERDVAIELIVVDDGSERRVSDLLADVEDPRLRIVPDAGMPKRQNRGESAARNAGVLVARGAFVRHVDCDDAIVPGSTARLLDLREADPSDLLVTFGGITYCDAEMKPSWTLGCRLEGEMFEPVMRGRLDTYVPCLLIPRPLLDSVGPWDESLPLCADLDFVFRLAEQARIRGDETSVYLYRRHPSSASMKGTDSGEDPMLSVYRRHYARHPEHVGTKVERWLDAAYVMQKAIQHWNRRSLRGVLRTLARALRLSPADAWHHLRTEVRSRRLQRHSAKLR